MSRESSSTVTKSRASHPEKAWRFEFLAATLLTCERLAIAAGLLLFVLSSYAWWGSPETPLASFWKGALLAAVLVAILRWGHWWALKKLLRMGRDHIREQRRLGLLARSSSESGVEIIRRRSE